MAEYIAFDPTVEVYGQSMLSVVSALGDQAESILAKHGLDNIDPNSWYPIQDYLDAYKELADMDYFNLVAVGMQVPDNAVFPPEIDTVEKALMSVGQAYEMNHRGGDIGEYTFTLTGEREGDMYCRNPYPSDFDYGIIYRIVQKFRPTDSTEIRVVRDDSVPNRKSGADACTYHIGW